MGDSFTRDNADSAWLAGEQAQRDGLPCSPEACPYENPHAIGQWISGWKYSEQCSIRHAARITGGGDHG